MRRTAITGIRYFHVVGGGCFGSQYVRWLLRARSLGMLEFEGIRAIDRDPACRLLREGPRDPALEVWREDWIDYFQGTLLRGLKEPAYERDHWVPSPLSPHILFLGWMRAVQALRPELRFGEKPFRETVPTPVQIPLQSGSLAVSFAEWKCPVNCIEPSTCPKIQAPRDWDMKTALEGYFGPQGANRSAHVLQCRHLVHGVGTIPWRAILGEFRRTLGDLESKRTGELAVATVSGCHGLIGLADYQVS